MLVSFPSMGSGLNANAKEFVPTTLTPPSENEHKMGESPLFLPPSEPSTPSPTFSATTASTASLDSFASFSPSLSESHKAPTTRSTPTIPVKRKHSESPPTVQTHTPLAFEHPTVTPIPLAGGSPPPQLQQHYESLSGGPQMPHIDAALYFASAPLAQHSPTASHQRPTAHTTRTSHLRAHNPPRQQQRTTGSHNPHNPVSSSRYLPASSFQNGAGRSRNPSGSESSRHRRTGGGSGGGHHSTRRETLKNHVHGLLRKWQVRDGTVGRVLVLRGLPGTGKSKIAQLLSSHAVTCSVDRFYAARGITTFDSSRMKEALKACRQDFSAAINNRQSLVILDNINFERWHYAHEIEAARRMGYSVRIWELRPETVDDFWAAWRRNAHNVSENQFLAYHRRWETEPGAQYVPVLYA